MDGEDTRQAEQLEREIEETREQIDHTVDQLEERLSMDHLMSEVRGRLNETAHTVLDVIEQHPSAVIGAVTLGAVLLHRRRAARARSLASFERAATDLVRLLQSRATATASQAREATQNGSHSLGQLAGELGQYAAGAFQQAGNGLVDVAHQAREHGEDLLDQLRESELRPLLPYGVLALAIAAGLGLARARRD